MVMRNQMGGNTAEKVNAFDHQSASEEDPNKRYPGCSEQWGRQ